MATEVRGRRPGFTMSHEHRTKISNSKILNRLIACAEGEVEMTSTQATVAIALLKKVMPDLAATEITGADGEAIQAVLEIKRSIVDPRNPNG